MFLTHMLTLKKYFRKTNTNIRRGGGKERICSRIESYAAVRGKELNEILKEMEHQALECHMVNVMK